VNIEKMVSRIGEGPERLSGRFEVPFSSVGDKIRKNSTLSKSLREKKSVQGVQSLN